MFRKVVEAQGGDPRAVDDPDAHLARAPRVTPVDATADGFITSIDAYAIGEAIVALGGGRRAAADRIDPAVGIVFERKVGDAVKAGETIALVHAGAAGAVEPHVAAVQAAVQIGAAAPASAPLIRHRAG